MTENLKNKKYLLKISLIWFALTLVAYLLRGLISSEKLLKGLCIETTVVFALVFYHLWKWKGTPFKVVTLFVLMCFLYLQGQVLLDTFDLTKDGLLSGKFSSRELVGGILAVHVFLSLLLTAISSAKGQKRKFFSGRENLADETVVLAGTIIALCALPFELYVNLTKLKFALTDGYASLYQEAALAAIPSGAKILSYFFLPGCFYLFFGSARKSRAEYAALLGIVAHGAVELLIGYRASAVIPLLLVIYGIGVKNRYEKSVVKRKKNRRTIFLLCALGALVVLVVFPVVRATRNSGGLAALTWRDIFSVENVRSIFSTVNDMGKSLQTVIYTLRLVPEEYPFRYGVTYLVNLTEIFPNFFWAVHPAEAYGSLGRWLTKIVDYSFWKYGGALGYSCVAEAYINFGYFGILGFAFLLGRVLERTESKVDAADNAAWYASWAIVATDLLFYPRGEFSSLVRGIFWYMLLPLLFCRILRRIRGKDKKKYSLQRQL